MPNCAFCEFWADSTTGKSPNCRGIRIIVSFICSSLLFWVPQTNGQSFVPPINAPKK